MTLDLTLQALADPTRRALLARLLEGPATVNELAEPHALTLPTVSRHIATLERAGLVTKGREAQWRPCRLAAAPLRELDAWLTPYRAYFETRLDRLEAHLDQETP
jgi:DNA-binding transcriptional ArsR family regulator